jgi:hypothetical protein
MCMLPDFNLLPKRSVHFYEHTCLEIPAVPNFGVHFSLQNVTYSHQRVIKLWFTTIQSWVVFWNRCTKNNNKKGKVKGKVHPRTGNEALYRPYGP